jgi:hypothetical protein
MEKKLTLITIATNGIRVSHFANVAPCKDGKVRLTGKDINNILAQHNIYPQRGQTISIG